MCSSDLFQSAMFDKDTLVITYDSERGEPRGPRSKKADPAQTGLGSCVDCGLCVQVCPTGIDIRKGLQYECIGCAACIDGCNQVMDRMGYARGLIRYSSENAVKQHMDFRGMLRRVARPRVLVYSAVLGAIVAGLLTAITLRVPLKVDIIRDRAAIAREVEDGQIENVFRLQVMNTVEERRSFRISASGLPGLKVVGDTEVEMDPASTRMVTIKLRAPSETAPGSHRVMFEINDTGNAHVAAHEKSVFVVRAP